MDHQKDLNKENKDEMMNTDEVHSLEDRDKNNAKQSSSFVAGKIKNFNNRNNRNQGEDIEIEKKDLLENFIMNTNNDSRAINYIDGEYQEKNRPNSNTNHHVKNNLNFNLKNNYNSSSAIGGGLKIKESLSTHNIKKKEDKKLSLNENTPKSNSPAKKKEKKKKDSTIKNNIFLAENYNNIKKMKEENDSNKN